MNDFLLEIVMYVYLLYMKMPRGKLFAKLSLVIKIKNEKNTYTYK